MAYAISTYQGPAKGLIGPKAAGALDLILVVGLGALALVAQSKLSLAARGTFGGIAIVIFGADLVALATPRSPQGRLLSETRKVILYTSLTAAPAGDHHASALATAKRYYESRGMKVVSMHIGIGDQGYHERKERKKERDIAGYKAKIMTEAERKASVEQVIERQQKEGGMFEGAVVQFQEDKNHRRSYDSLQRQNPDATVVFVCGSDTCRDQRIMERQKFDHVAVVVRGEGDPGTIIRESQGTVTALVDKSNDKRFAVSEEHGAHSCVLLRNAYKDFEAQSSTLLNQQAA